MEKQRVRDQLGALEEQLELLEEVSLKNDARLFLGKPDTRFEEESLRATALDELDRLRSLVQEQSLQKSIPARDFLKKVVAILIRESASAGQENIAVSTSGSGRISMDMVEICMGAILACLRVSLKSFEGTSAKSRLKQRLFCSHSYYLEVHGSPEEVFFRLMDDGSGVPLDTGGGLEGAALFQRVRTHISRHGGWFCRKPLLPCGEAIEFKIPMPSGRFNGRILKAGNLEILLPSSCVAEIRSGRLAAPVRKESRLIAVLDAEYGLRAVAADEGDQFALGVRVVVADLEFWIRCESAQEPLKTRKISADGFVEPGSWFKHFGAYQRDGAVYLLPLLEGESMARFYIENWRGDAGK